MRLEHAARPVMLGKTRRRHDIKKLKTQSRISITYRFQISEGTVGEFSMNVAQGVQITERLAPSDGVDSFNIQNKNVKTPDR